MDLLRGHPSLIGTKIIKRYREYLGETYTQLRQSVILAVSNKRHIPVTPFSGCSFQKPNEEIRHHTGTLDDQVSDDSQSSVGGTLLPPTPAQQCTLQTDVRIATPTVIFFENNNESQNTQPNVSLQHSGTGTCLIPHLYNPELSPSELILMSTGLDRFH